MVILNRYKYIIVTVLMIISILSINVIKPKAELIDSINLIINGRTQTVTRYYTYMTEWGNITLIQGHKYYLSAKRTLVNGSYDFATGSIVSLTPTNVTLLSGNLTNLNSPLLSQVIFEWTQPTRTGLLLFYGSYSGGTVICENVMLIDLTVAYGEGNEPNIIDCNAIYSEYFEGLKRQDIKPYDVTENAHKTFIQMIVSTMLVPIDMLKRYKVGNKINLFDIFIGMIILVILTKTILKIGGKISNDVR